MSGDILSVTESGGSVKLSRTYALTQKLGEGGMGEVHKVCYEEMGKLYWAAIKILDKTKFSKPKDLEVSISRFHREVELLKLVKHSNIIGFVSAFETPEKAYLVMEYAEGVTMDKWVMQFRGEPPAELLVDILLDVLDALLYMKGKHGMHHRDIKPENIMVKVLPDGQVSATLIDFGNTKVQEADNNAKGLTMMSGVMAGTIGYLPPAVYAGIYTEEDDVFALAATLLFGLLKYEPFVAEDRAKSNEKIARKDYDLGAWQGTFLGHWINQNVDSDRRKRMTLRHAQRSLQRFKENPDIFGKCSPEKVKLYASDTALLSMAEQGREGEAEYTPPPQDQFGRIYGGAPKNAPAAPTPADVDPVAAKSLAALDKALATPLPESKQGSKRRLVILLSLLALSAAGAGVAYWLGGIP